jgi:hypothetical protein
MEEITRGLNKRLCPKKEDRDREMKEVEEFSKKFKADLYEMVQRMVSKAQSFWKKK